MQIKRFLNIAVVVLAIAGLAAAATIPPGTTVYVRTTTSLNSGTAHVGETWHGSLDRDLVVNGATLARKGAAVLGRVTLAKDSGRLHAPGELTLRVISVNGAPVTSSAYFVKGKGHMKGN